MLPSQISVHGVPSVAVVVSIAALSSLLQLRLESANISVIFKQPSTFQLSCAGLHGIHLEMELVDVV